MLRYALRSLWAQGVSVLPTVLAVFFSIAIVTSMSLVTNNVTRAVMTSGRADNLTVRSADALTFEDGDLPVSMIGQLRALPGLENGGEGSTWTTEQFGRVRARRLDTGVPAELKMHCVDPAGYVVHPDIHILSGSIPAPGTPGVLVGVQLLNRYKGVAPGGSVRVGTQIWPVLGTFEAKGSAHESELWCDRTALLAVFQMSTFSDFVARTKDHEGMESAIRAASAVRQPQLLAESESAYNARQAEGLRPYILIAWLLTGVLMIGTTFACVGTMNALLVSRRRELATLLAIGFTQRRLCWMLTLETGVLVGLGALAGMATTMLEVGRAYFFKDWHLVVRIEPIATPILHGAVVAGIVAFLGAIIAIVEIKRMVVLDALREA